MGSSKPRPKAKNNPQQQLEETQRVRRLQEKDLRAVEQEAITARRKQEKAVLKQQAQKQAARHLAKQQAELAKHHEHLAGYARYKEAYNKNLVREGFEIRGENWERPFKAEDGTIQLVGFKQLPNVNLIRDIPSNLNAGKCNYIDVTWGEIKIKHMWYVKRNANYLRHRFVIDKRQSWRSSLSDGMFAFHVDAFAYQVWTWPGAIGDDSLPEDDFPHNDPRAVYQDRSITEFDDFVLQRSGREKYLNNIDRLPSAQLGDWKDHWHRKMRNIDDDVIETYVSVPAGSSPVNIAKPLSKKDSLELTHKSLFCPFTLRRLRSWGGFSTRERLLGLALPCSRHRAYRPISDILRSHWGEKQQKRCYDRKIWRQLLDTVDWLSYIARRRAVWLSLFQRCSFWSKKTLPNDNVNKLKYTKIEVPGTLNGQKTAAFPDSGSAYNLLSHSYVMQNRIIFQKQERTITLPDGTKGNTIGFVSLEWVFEDAPDEVHNLLFHVLENCVHDVLFGNPFLDLTKLNTDNDSRIKRRVIPGPPTSSGGLGGVIYDCHLTGNIINNMSGELNDKQSYVIPDTGCQVNAISPARALALGWDGKYRGERGTFRFINGSTTPSLGAMKAIWSPAGSEEKYELEFEIMENCKGVIIGQNYLYGNRAFVKHAASMINADAGDIITADEIPNEENEGTISISNDSKDPNPPPHRTATPSTPIPAHEIITTDDEVYGVTYEASPFTRIRRRARGGRSRDAGARSQISSAAQEEMERRATTEDAIARMGNWEARIRAVEAEVNRRRFAGEDGRGNGALLRLLPPRYVGVARGEGETGDGSGGGDGSGNFNGNGDGTSGSS